MAAPPDGQAALTVILFAQRGGEESRSPAVRRVEAELRARGFDVVPTAGPGPEADPERSADAWAREMLKAHDVLGVLLLESRPAGAVSVDWWGPVAHNGDLAKRSVLVEGVTPDAAEILAVRTAELASVALDRAAALASSRAIAAPPSPPEPSAQVPVSGATRDRPVRRAPPPRWRASLGFGPTWSPGGLRVMAGPTLGGAVALSRGRRLGIGAESMVTVVRSPVDDGAFASRNLSIAIVRVHATWWIRPTKRLSPSLGLGGGLAAGWLDAGPRQRTAVGLFSVAPGLAIALSPRLAFAVGLRAALTTPRFEVRSVDRRVASAGLPVLDGWLALEIRG